MFLRNDIQTSGSCSKWTTKCGILAQIQADKWNCKLGKLKEFKYIRDTQESEQKRASQCMFDIDSMQEWGAT